MITTLKGSCMLLFRIELNLCLKNIAGRQKRCSITLLQKKKFHLPDSNVLVWIYAELNVQHSVHFRHLPCARVTSACIRYQSRWPGRPNLEKYFFHIFHFLLTYCCEKVVVYKILPLMLKCTHTKSQSMGSFTSLLTGLSEVLNRDSVSKRRRLVLCPCFLKHIVLWGSFVIYQQTTCYG